MSTRCGMCNHCIPKDDRYECDLTHESMSGYSVNHWQDDWTCPDFKMREINLSTGKKIRTSKCLGCGVDVWIGTDYCPKCRSKGKDYRELALPKEAVVSLYEAVFSQARTDYIDGKITLWKQDHNIKVTKDKLRDAEMLIYDVERFIRLMFGKRADMIIKTLDDDVALTVSLLEEKYKNGQQEPTKSYKRRVKR